MALKHSWIIWLHFLLSHDWLLPTCAHSPATSSAAPWWSSSMIGSPPAAATHIHTHTCPQRNQQSDKGVYVYFINSTHYLNYEFRIIIRFNCVCTCYLLCLTVPPAPSPAGGGWFSYWGLIISFIVLSCCRSSSSSLLDFRCRGEPAHQRTSVYFIEEKCFYPQVCPNSAVHWWPQCLWLFYSLCRSEETRP